MDREAAKAATKLLKELFSAFPTATRTDELQVAQTYLAVLDGFSVEAIQRSVGQFIRGNVATHDGRFAPSAAELSRNVRQWDEAIRQVEANRTAPPLASGITSVDFGYGRIDMTRLTLEEQNYVLRTGRAPDPTLGPATVKLQRMGEQKRGFASGDPEGEADAA